jgi:xylulose-5-phosphate/fructose-6-phosphate phosphoketolase
MARAEQVDQHVHAVSPPRTKGNTPMELAITNQVDRFNLAIDVVDRVPRLQKTAAHVKDWPKSQIVDQLNYAYAEGIDREAIRNWTWDG